MLRYKPVAVIGASTGLFGAVWAQAEVRKVLKASGAHVLESELPVGMADYAFAEDGDALADPELDAAPEGPPRQTSCAKCKSPVETLMRTPPASQPDAARRASGRTRRATARASSRRRRRSWPSRGSRPSRWRPSRAPRASAPGTLYRRFGDRAGLAFALLDEHTRDFQNALISGPPPLGPGAPARERLRAFGEGYLDLLERHAALMVAAAPGAKEADGPYSLYTTHLAILLREAAPLLDAAFTAEALLATLSPAHHVRVRHGLGLVAGADARGLGRRSVDALSDCSARGAEAHHDPRLAGDGAERVMEAGGHDRLAARAQTCSSPSKRSRATPSITRSSVSSSGRSTQRRLGGERLERQRRAVADGGGGGDQGCHWR